MQDTMLCTTPPLSNDGSDDKTASTETEHMGITAESILHLIIEHQGLSITELVKRTQLPRSAIRVTLAKLEGAEKITCRKVGMAKLYLPKLFLLFFIVSFISILTCTRGFALTVDVTQYGYLTTNDEYDTSPSITFDGTTYWLFFTKATTGSVRSDTYFPELDKYHVYYKTSDSVLGLATAEEILLEESTTLSDSFSQRFASATHYHNATYVFVSASIDSEEQSIYYYVHNDSADNSTGNWSGPHLFLEDPDLSPNDPDIPDKKLLRVHVTSDDAFIYVISSNTTESLISTWNGEFQTLLAEIDPDEDIDVADITVLNGTIYLVGSLNYEGNDLVVYDGPAQAVPELTLESNLITTGHYQPGIFNNGSGLFVMSVGVDGTSYYLQMFTILPEGWYGPTMVSLGKYDEDGDSECYEYETWHDEQPTGFWDGNMTYLLFMSETEDLTTYSDAEIVIANISWSTLNNHYFSIQNALLQAEREDEILIHEGTYVENAIIENKYIVRGQHATMLGELVIRDSPVLIENLNLSADTAITIEETDASEINISNCSIFASTAIENQGTGSVQAALNYYSLDPYENHDVLQGDVMYSPWYVDSERTQYTYTEAMQERDELAFSDVSEESQDSVSLPLSLFHRGRYATLVWETNDSSIDEEGNVYYAPEGKAVEVSAGIRLTGSSREAPVYKNFSVTIQTSDAQSLVDEAAANLAFTDIQAANTAIDNISENLDLPITFSDCTVTWNSTKTSLIDEDGNVMPTEEEQNCTITALLERNGKTAEKEFTLTIPGEEQTPAGEAARTLTRSSVLGQNFGDIRTSLNLTQSIDNVSVDWTSSDLDVLRPSGSATLVIFTNGDDVIDEQSITYDETGVFTGNGVVFSCGSCDNASFDDDLAIIGNEAVCGIEEDILMNFITQDVQLCARAGEILYAINLTSIYIAEEDCIDNADGSCELAGNLTSYTRTKIGRGGNVSRQNRTQALILTAVLNDSMTTKEKKFRFNVIENMPTLVGEQASVVVYPGMDEVTLSENTSSVSISGNLTRQIYALIEQPLQEAIEINRTPYRARLPQGMSGLIQIPTQSEESINTTYIVNDLVTVGYSTSAQLTNPLQLIFEGAGDKRAGIIENGSITDILDQCTNSDEPGITEGQCLYADDDVSIWTFHLSTFVTFSAAAQPERSAHSSTGTSSSNRPASAAAACTPSWTCSAWSDCTGKRTRTCIDENNCNKPRTQPPLEETCTPSKEKQELDQSKVSALKKKVALFDIIAELITDSITADGKLLAKITLINFGSSGEVDTNLHYLIRDENDKIVYEAREVVTVITQKEYIRPFDVSAFAPGTYKLSIELLYEGQQEEAFTEKTFVIGKKQTFPFLIFLPVLALFAGGYFLVRKRKKDEQQTPVVGKKQPIIREVLTKASLKKEEAAFTELSEDNPGKRLAKTIRDMDDITFRQYVSSKSFPAWIREKTHDEQLALKLQGLADKEAILNVLEKAIPGT
ncbi:MAG: winged helix-turn-helix domain-containing protein [archaeon]